MRSPPAADDDLRRWPLRDKASEQNLERIEDTSYEVAPRMPSTDSYVHGRPQLPQETAVRVERNVHQHEHRTPHLDLKAGLLKQLVYMGQAPIRLVFRRSLGLAMQQVLAEYEPPAGREHHGEVPQRLLVTISVNDVKEHVHSRHSVIPNAQLALGYRDIKLLDTVLRKASTESVNRHPSQVRSRNVPHAD